jgi:hypothetical protein
MYCAGDNTGPISQIRSSEISFPLWHAVDAVNSLTPSIFFVFWQKWQLDFIQKHLSSLHVNTQDNVNILRMQTHTLTAVKSNIMKLDWTKSSIKFVLLRLHYPL